MKYEGDINNFKAEAVQEYHGRRSVFKVSFKNEQTMEGTVSLRTPYKRLRDVSAGFSHSGSLTDFNSAAFVKYAPRKQIDVKVDLFTYQLRRINANFEVKTPFAGYELTSFSVKHTGSSRELKCTANVIYGSGSRIAGVFKAAAEPLSVDLSVSTPFTGFEDMSVKGKYIKTGNSRSANANIKYATGKEIEFVSTADLISDPVSLTARFTTPFSGYESTELTYTHEGTITNFRCSSEFHASYVSPINAELQSRFSSPVDMLLRTTFTSPFENFENLRFSLRNENELDGMKSHTEISWSTDKSIIVDASMNRNENWNGNVINTGLSITTPCEKMRSMSFKGRHELAASKYTETFSAELNDNHLVDMDVEFGHDASYVAGLTMRQPKPISFSISGLKSETSASGDLSVNWDTSSSDSNIRVGGTYTTDSASKKDVSLTISTPRKSVEMTGSARHSDESLSTTTDLSINGEHKIGLDYEFTNKNRRNDKEKGSKLKIRLPSRSVEASGSLNERYGRKSVEGALLWDADRDETKKVAVKGNMSPQGQTNKADVSFSFPSLGKDIKIDSEMTLHSGRIMFDGKTEFKYSEDDRKKIVINSRIEDLSSWNRKNYSFAVGISHPYTSVDVQMVSHIGQSDNKYSAGVDLKYMTANRNRQTYALIGEIDSLRKQMKIDVVSPLKNMQLNGEVNDETPFRISMRNFYDGRPVSSELVVDRRNPSVDFSLNYDKHNPRTVFHAKARYLTDRSIQAEIYRESNNRRTTDALLSLSLNTSKILHTRIHWRPSIIQDIKRAGVESMLSESQRLDAVIAQINSGVGQELDLKYNIIKRSLIEEIKPVVDVLKTNVQELESGSFDTSYLYNLLNGISEYMQESASTFSPFPLKRSMNSNTQALRVILQSISADSREKFAEVMDHIDIKTRDLYSAIEESIQQYHAHANEAISRIGDMKFMKLVNRKYGRALRYAGQISQLPTQYLVLPANYNSAIYDAREAVNQRLADVLQRPGARYIKSQANSAYHLGRAAYKYWEIKENTDAIIDAMYEYIIEVIDEEFDALKNTFTHLQRSTITVYDPENGEIQMDTFLPFAMPSLRRLPRISFSHHLNRMRTYIPDTSRFGSVSDYIPDSDVTNWIPPFKGHAIISGDKFTTFDGRTYPFSGRCSYILARDFTDGNFSIILNYMAKSKRKLVVMTAQHNVQLLPNNKVRLDGALTRMPVYSSDVSVTDEGHNIRIAGRGFNVEYRNTTDTYDVSLSGWYHGKTGGLLGTLDNERHNDMMMSNRQIAEDPTTLANTWEVNEKCR